MPWVESGSTLRDSAQDGLGHGAAVSPITACNLRWKRISTQSMIRMMRCGGRPSFLTVAINIHQNSDVTYFKRPVRSVYIFFTFWMFEFALN